MKKLMIAALALCAAYGAQAMSVDWKVQLSSATKGYDVYLLMGDVKTDWAAKADIIAAAVDTGVIKQSGPNYLVNDTAEDDAITKSGKFYFAVVKSDGSQYAVSSAFTASEYVYDTTAKPPETSPGLATWKNTGALAYNDFKSVPEPTSAMLLLLGVAGLALKRKRA